MLYQFILHKKINKCMLCPHPISLSLLLTSLLYIFFDPTIPGQFALTWAISTRPSVRVCLPRFSRTCAGLLDGLLFLCCHSPWKACHGTYFNAKWLFSRYSPLYMLRFLWTVVRSFVFASPVYSTVPSMSQYPTNGIR